MLHNDYNLTFLTIIRKIFQVSVFDQIFAFFRHCILEFISLVLTIPEQKNFKNSSGKSVPILSDDIIHHKKKNYRSKSENLKLIDNRLW